MSEDTMVIATLINNESECEPATDPAQALYRRANARWPMVLLISLRPATDEEINNMSVADDYAAYIKKLLQMAGSEVETMSSPERTEELRRLLNEGALARASDMQNDIARIAAAEAAVSDEDDPAQGEVFKGEVSDPIPGAVDVTPNHKK